MNFKGLEIILRDYNAPVLKYLQEGLTKETILKKIKRIDINFPEELVDLYTWRNGTRWEKVKLGLLSLFPGAMFFTLETAIDTYLGRVGQDEYWRNKLFPIFGGGANFYLMDLDSNSPTYEQIFYYCLNETDFEVIISYFDSLETCLETIVECYKDNGFYFFKDDKGQMVSSDPIRFRRIAKRLNPNSEYWKLSNWYSDN